MKISIRDLFLVIAIVGLGLGWWLDRMRGEARFEKADARAYVLEEMLYEVGFDIEWTGDRIKAKSVGYDFDWPVDKATKGAFRRNLLPKP